MVRAVGTSALFSTSSQIHLLDLVRVWCRRQCLPLACLGTVASRPRGAMCGPNTAITGPPLWTTWASTAFLWLQSCRLFNGSVRVNQGGQAHGIWVMARISLQGPRIERKGHLVQAKYHWVVPRQTESQHARWQSFHVDMYYILIKLEMKKTMKWKKI